MLPPPTNQDVGDEAGWSITDAVTQLRLVGTNQVYALAFLDTGERIIGATAECAIQLRDPAGRVSRRHASLTEDRGVWLIRDLGSTNGIRQDGELRQTIQLAAGVEVEIGGVPLIAESPRLLALRALLQRVLGFSPDAVDAVDRAVQAVRMTAIRRTGLLICGAGDLTGIARRIHDHVVGADRPFVVCADDLDPEVVARASSGTLCLVARRRTAEVPRAAAVLRLPDSRIRTIVCAPTSVDVPNLTAMLAKASIVEIPTLASRPGEIDRLIDAYASDAVTALTAPATGFREHEHDWLRSLDYESLAEIEDVALRVVALRNWGVSGGASRLGITHGALSTWASRRKIPT